MKPKESDWKKFRNSLDKWRERYLKRKNDEIRAILEDSDLNETEKFWNIVDFQKNESKRLRELSGWLFQIKHDLAYGYYEKIRNELQDDIEEFSEELQKFLKEIERI